MVLLTAPLWLRSRLTDRYWRVQEVLKHARHFRGRKNRCYRLAVRAVTRAWVKCTKARRLKKRIMRTVGGARPAPPPPRPGFLSSRRPERSAPGAAAHSPREAPGASRRPVGEATPPARALWPPPRPLRPRSSALAGRCAARRAAARPRASRTLLKGAQLWINRISAASQEHGLKYPAFIVGLIKCQVELNRKVLADLAIYEPKTFKSLAALAKRRRQEGFAAALGDGKEPEGIFSRVVQYH